MLGEGPANKNNLKIPGKRLHLEGPCVLRSPPSCCFHLALTQSQREKLVISQFPPLGCLHALAEVHSNIGLTSSMRQMSTQECLNGSVVQQRAATVRIHTAADVHERMSVYRLLWKHLPHVFRPHR